MYNICLFILHHFLCKLHSFQSIHIHYIVQVVTWTYLYMSSQCWWKHRSDKTEVWNQSVEFANLSLPMLLTRPVLGCRRVSGYFPFVASCSGLDYRKFPKYWDTQNICCNHSKIWTMWLYHRVMSPNNADGMANSVDPVQTAPRAIWSGSALFGSSLFRVYTVCPGISVRKLGIITVVSNCHLSYISKFVVNTIIRIGNIQISFYLSFSMKHLSCFSTDWIRHKPTRLRIP